MPEITIDDEFGKAIAATVAACRVQSVIEIGSWDGCGSTAVLLASLAEVPNRRLVCVEPDRERHAQLANRVASMPWVETVCSRSVSRAAMTAKTFSDVWQSPYNRLRYPMEAVQEWWDQQHDGPGYLESLADETWDAAVIDGCEFAGYDDFRLLRNRVRVLMLDDVFCAFKCSRAHEELRSDVRWHCIWSSIFVRNGASIWIRQ
jgi:hypothetical protein